MFYRNAWIKNKTAARLAIAGMLFQAFLAIFHIQAQAIGQAASFKLFSKTIVICTEHGLKTIVLNETGDTEKESNSKIKGQCPVCLFFASNTIITAEQFTLPCNCSGKTRQFARLINRITDNSPTIHFGRDPPCEAGICIYPMAQI